MDNTEKDKGAEPLPYCRLAQVAEHERAEEADEPCNDYRAGIYKYPAVIDEEKLSNLVKGLHPAIAEYGIDVTVSWDNDKKVWDIELKRGEHILTTSIEADDAALCLETKECPALRTKIDELKADIIKG
jgi:hypothetical protein